MCGYFFALLSLLSKYRSIKYCLCVSTFCFGFRDFCSAFVIGGNAGNTFYIDPLSGQIFTRWLLDFEVTSSHQLTVRVTDGGGRSDDATVTINVQPINDNKPNCSATPRVVLVDETERLVTTASHLISI